MILTRIRVGDVKPWAMGKKPCVTFPCLTQPPQLIAAAVSWGSYCFGSGCSRTVSPFPHAHSTHGWLHNGKRNHCHHSRRHYSLYDGAERSRTSNSHPLYCLFIHAQAGSYSSSRRDHNLSIIPMHRYSSALGSHNELGDVRFHPWFPCEGPFVFSVMSMFFLTNLCPVHMFPLPSCELGFSFHPWTV